MLAVVMCLVSFSWGLAYIGLPFHVARIGAADPATTLAWTGWIVGITPLAAVVSTPVWARLAGRIDPKRACVAIQSLQGVGFLGTALAGSLPGLFLARLALGVVGSTSTFAFILAGHAAEPAEVRRRVAAVQSAITVGGVFGPLAGALAAARLGFRLAFVLGGAVMTACAGLVHWGIPRPAEGPAGRDRPGRLPIGDLARVCPLALVSSCQESFLVAALPQVLPGLGVGAADLVETGGMLVFASGAAAALGGLAAPRLAQEIPERRLLGGLVACASVAVMLLALTPSLWSYTVCRVVQSMLVAPLFPLLVARVARHRSGDAISWLNASRVGGHFLGPVLATSLLAWGPPALVYLVLGGLGLASLAGARR